MKNEDKYEEYMQFAQTNYSSRVNADNLLALEKGLKQNLESVQARLSEEYGDNDNRTVREVLEAMQDEDKKRG